jgi:hypothetical protein
MAGRLAAHVRAGNRAAIARMAARLDGVSEKALQKQAARAVVSVRRKAQPLAKRIVRQVYAVQSTALSDAFDAANGVEGGQAFVALRARVAPVSLIRFGGRWNKRAAGATAEIMRGERKAYESAFISVMPNGGRHIFARAPQGNGKRAPRLPLRRLHGPSAYQMVQGKRGETADQVTEELAAYAADETLRLIAAARKGR